MDPLPKLHFQRVGKNPPYNARHDLVRTQGQTTNKIFLMQGFAYADGKPETDGPASPAPYVELRLPCQSTAVRSAD